MSKNPNEVEVTLAVDLPVGPRGGVVKADDQVRLPYDEAQRLVYLGQARYEKRSAPVVPAANEAGTGTGAPVEGGNK